MEERIKFKFGAEVAPVWSLDDVILHVETVDAVAVDALFNVSDHYSVTIDSGCLLTVIKT